MPHRLSISGLSSISGMKEMGWYIGDLGLSKPANDTPSNNEIYGVIPYIAPEIFKGAAFSKESDIYSFGMIMWELTTGENNAGLIYKIIDKKRPEITNDTPRCFADLMKKCWDSDPLKSPSISEIEKKVYYWCININKYHKQEKRVKLIDYQHSNKYHKQFEQAEEKRVELIQSKKLGPEFSIKPNPKAVFTSRPLSSLISKSSYLSSMVTSQGMYCTIFISINSKVDLIS